MLKALQQSSIFVTAALLVFGCCRVFAQGTPSSNNWVQSYSLFLPLRESEEGPVVLQFPPNVQSPAQSAGIRAGDIILAVNGRRVSGWDIRRLMNVNIGEDVRVAVFHHGRQVKLRVRPKELLIRPSVKMLLNLLGAGRKVAITVFVTGVENNCLSLPAGGDGGKAAWKKTEQERLRKDVENAVLESIGKAPNFSFVERSRIECALPPHWLKESVPILAQGLIKVGKRVGVTHLLLISETVSHLSGNFCRTT